MSAARTRLALPIDMYRTAFDATVTQTQIDNNTPLGSQDDRDVVYSMIEDAEDEFRRQTDRAVELSRAGTAGDRATYDQLTYEVPGHENFKRQWSRVGGDYLNQEVTKNLTNERILPFDPAEGDEAFIYRGVSGTHASGDQWDDVTDEQGETWDIIDHRAGTVAIHPLEVDRAMLSGGAGGVGLSRGRLREFRMAISYRYGTLGGSREDAGATTLTASVTDTETTPFTVGVSDASRLPSAGGGAEVFLLGDEYVRATVDASADELTVVERAVRGTNASAHDSDDRVGYTPGAVRKAVAARAGMAYIDAGRYSGWLPDTEDDLDKSDLYSNIEDIWTTTVEAMTDG